MKTKMVLLFTLFSFLSCSTNGDCTYNGHTLQQGSQGGCYYLNSSGNKEYVDQSYCNC